MLIVPRVHAHAFGKLPPDLDSEFLTLKDAVRCLLSARYAPPAFFEHGVIGQTVGHAHLHVLPTNVSILPLLREQPSFMEITGPPGPRRYYEAYGGYFYYEDGSHGYAMAPARARPGELHLLFAEAMGLPPAGRADLARAGALNRRDRRVIAAWAEEYGESSSGRGRDS